MKVIITDVDGVISLDGSSLDDNCLNVLKKIVDKTGAVVVISSTWRLQESQTSKILNKFYDLGITVVGRTKDLPLSDNMWEDRVEEILEWIERHSVEKWIAIDDLPLEELLKEKDENKRNEIKKHFVKTEILDGLTESQIEECICKLN